MRDFARRLRHPERAAYLSESQPRHYHVAFARRLILRFAYRLKPIYDKAVIVGVGLLGGSIALALKQRHLTKHVVGVGRPGRAPHSAVETGMLDAASDDLTAAAQDADLVICCAPVQQIADHAIAAASVANAECLITDVGSTKLSIVDAVTDHSAQIRFVGSHPLAGGTNTGFQHAQADLLSDSLVVVTPTEHTSPALLEQTLQLWRSLGARTLVMSPAEHDAALAITSHLPHILASALAGFTPRDLLPLTATGWRSTTRIAAGSAQLWRQILEENRLPALEALQNFDAVLKQWLAALQAGDGPAIERLLEEGKATRDALGS